MTKDPLWAVSSERWERCQTTITERFGWSSTQASEPTFHHAVLRACKAARQGDINAYIDRLIAGTLDRAALEQLVAELTVGETYFFRDRACFERLERQIFPALIEARRAGSRQIRIWSAGCSTGDEPYSIAILLDRLVPDIADWHITVLATDINRRALETAHEGVYRAWSLRETPRGVVEHYFRRRQKEVFELAPDLRSRVSFAYLNLVEDVFPSFLTTTNAMDVIVCRNVLMYLDSQRRQQVIDKFHHALTEGGHLIVSPTECSLPQFAQFETVSHDLTTFYRKRSGRPAPVMTEPTVASPWPRRVELAQPPARAPRFAGSRPADIATSPPRALQATDAATWHTMARGHANRGHLEEARRCCESAIAQDRLNPTSYYLLASIELEQGETAAAIQALHKAIYSDATFVLAHFLLGSVLQRVGEVQRGQRCFETVIELLRSAPSDTLVSAGEGMSTGRLRELATWYLGERHAS